MTAKAQLSPGARLPPIKVRRVPSAEAVKEEPAPQGGSGIGGRFAVSPPRTVARSSVKVMPVAARAASSLRLRVNSRVTVAPGGTVYAVDISETFVSNILHSSREQGLNNVEGIVNTPREAGLPERSIDLAFLADTYHHFEYPQSMLASIHRGLRDHGRLLENFLLHEMLELTFGRTDGVPSDIVDFGRNGLTVQIC